MRFYEFAVDDKYGDSIINVESLLIYDLPIDAKLTEDDSRNIVEFKDFVADYKTDPSELVVGDDYYAFSMAYQPFAGILRIHYSDEVVKFLGLEDKYYIFKSSKTYRLPMDRASDSIALCTTVFEEVERANEFLTALMLKYSGEVSIVRI